MNNKFEEFDVIVAPLEIDYVCNEIEMCEILVAENTGKRELVARLFRNTISEILENPTKHWVTSMQTRITTEEQLPALAKIMYEDE